MVIHLVIMALKSSVKDGSPFVRKTAAHALPKVIKTDPEQEPSVLEMLVSLLNDREPMVLSSAVFAFMEVRARFRVLQPFSHSFIAVRSLPQICPEKWDLIHPHFRKLCHLLADLDEWGQVRVGGLRSVWQVLFTRRVFPVRSLRFTP